MNAMNTPLYDAVARAPRRGPRFFVPGHKGNPNALPQLAGLLDYDLTEIEGLDDLQHPSGPLAQSQANMALAYGSGATLYSASGSTSCIMAMLALFCRPGKRLVIARGCHSAAVRAMALLDLQPHWVPLQDGRPQAEDVEAALRESRADAVYITSVDYYGRIPDIAALAAACRAHGAALLCDNAHGAYLHFLPQSRHPLQLGADACADSAHKTLSCLTPAALLHLQNGQLAGKGREMLNLFSSTSPSYPVLVSLDLAAAQLLQQPPDFSACAAQVSRSGSRFSDICLPCDDGLRLHLCPPLAGYDAAAFAGAMREQGVFEEYFDGENIIYMATPANTAADFTAWEKAVETALASLPRHAVPPGTGAAMKAFDAVPGKSVCSVREAFFTAERESVPVQQATGRVLAGICAPCPPGVPVAVPGETITPSCVTQFLAGGILQVDVIK